MQSLCENIGLLIDTDYFADFTADELTAISANEVQKLVVEFEVQDFLAVRVEDLILKAGLEIVRSVADSKISDGCEAKEVGFSTQK